jgi:hypothetical protein
MFGTAPHFELSLDIVRATNSKDAINTCIDLHTLGLLHLPYPGLYVTGRFDEFDSNPNWTKQNGMPRNEPTLITAYLVDDLNVVRDASGNPKLRIYAPPIIWLRTLDGQSTASVNCNTGLVTITHEDGQIETRQGNVEGVKFLVSALCACLVASLATHNVEKTTSVNSRIGTSKPSRSQYRGPNGITYISNTRLEVPANLNPDADHPGKCPHIRRGHIHTFAHGEGRALRKQQWVAPIFVNVDADYIAQHKKYKLVA